ncbi:MAG: hypothetical protein AAFW46_02975 [Pseudomonadota bacterium]
MPPRVPIAFLFVVGYFAVVAGGGADAPLREPPREFWPFADVLPLTLGQLLVFLAAAISLVDASWRPACTVLDLVISVLCAAIALGAPVLDPTLMGPSYAVLATLCLGDALAAAGRPGAKWRAE